MDLESEMKAFIVENFLFGSEEGDLQAEDSFLEKGLIDSTGVLEIVGFVEGRYGIRVEDDEIVPENFDSIRKLVRYIGSKQGISVGGGAIP